MALPGMAAADDLRPAEQAVAAPAATDAGLVFIGRIRTPWQSRPACPRQGHDDGPLCRIELFAPWEAALAGITDYQRLEIIYWLHLARRDLVRQSPRNDGETRGTFAIRSPMRPNPIGTSIVTVVTVEPAALVVRGLDCLDGTPLLDIKPDRALFVPPAPPTPGDRRPS